MQEDLTYKCRLCNRDIKLLKNHLKYSHEKMDIDTYFEKTNDKNNYDRFNNLIFPLRKKRSPNCIEFYTSKGYSKDEGMKLLEEHRSKLPFRKKKNFRPNQIDYWIKKGFSETESIEKVRLFQSNSKESLVKKYGEDGNRRYNEFIESLNKRRHTEIHNIIEQFGINDQEAKNIFDKRRVVVSPRREEYWINKGYSEIDSKEKVSEWQMICSPRTTRYWINKGYSKNEANGKVKEYQDNNSINSLMIRYNLTFNEALDKQSEFIDKMIKSRIDKGINLQKSDRKSFDVYLNNVRKLTNKYYKKYTKIINSNNYNRSVYEYHLDHKISIFSGFKNNIDYRIISSPYNLQMISAKDNLEKSINSDISVSTLINEYNQNKLKI